MAQNRSTILFVASLPYNLKPLDIQKERDELNLAIATCKTPDKFEVVEARSIQPSELGRILRQTKRLAVMHFAGHGQRNGDFSFQDRHGKQKIVGASALGDLLEMATTVGLKIVVLNTCYSDEKAQYIAEKVGITIGMRGNIEDDAAIEFTREFYGALGDSLDFSVKNVQQAFNWAHSGLRLSFPEEAGKPRLFLRQRMVQNPGHESQGQGNALSSGQKQTKESSGHNTTFSGNNYSGIQVGSNSGTINLRN